jgi:hypothetical protein
LAKQTDRVLRSGAPRAAATAAPTIVQPIFQFLRNKATAPRPRGWPHNVGRTVSCKNISRYNAAIPLRLRRTGRVARLDAGNAVSAEQSHRGCGETIFAKQSHHAEGARPARQSRQINFLQESLQIQCARLIRDSIRDEPDRHRKIPNSLLFSLFSGKTGDARIKADPASRHPCPRCHSSFGNAALT